VRIRSDEDEYKYWASGQFSSFWSRERATLQQELRIVQSYVMELEELVVARLHNNATNINIESSKTPGIRPSIYAKW